MVNTETFKLVQVTGVSQLSNKPAIDMREVHIVIVWAMSSNKTMKRGKKNTAAIALQCESMVKLIAALLFIPYNRLILGDETN